MTYELNTKGGWVVPANSAIPANSVIPSYSELGDDCTLGDGCTLGNDCTWLGVTVESWLTLANVDGTGRQVKVVKHASGIKIEAGCFIGTPEEFTAKAESEGKLSYVAVIKAVAEVL